MDFAPSHMAIAIRPWRAADQSVDITQTGYPWSGATYTRLNADTQCANRSATNSVEKCDKQFLSRGRQLKKIVATGDRKNIKLNGGPLFRA